MAKIVKILKKEYSDTSNAVDNRIFQHRNQHRHIMSAYLSKLLRACANCRNDAELQVFWNRRAEMYNKHKEIVYEQA